MEYFHLQPAVAVLYLLPLSYCAMRHECL